MDRLSLIPIIIATILLPSTIILTVNGQGITLTPEDNEAKQKIISNLSDAVDHKYDRYTQLYGKVEGDNSTFLIYNKTGVAPIPPVVCGVGTHEENGVCVPDVPQCPDGQFFNETSQQCQDKPVPPVEPPGNETTTSIGMVGDITNCGSGIIDTLDAKNYAYNVALGDLCYGSNLNTFIPNWDQLNNHRCVIGNHDSEEDGSSQIAQQAKEYCTDIWIEKIAGGTTVLIGVNTNGNLDVQLGTAQEYVMNEELMQGVKNVVLLTHKPCVNPPNPHHVVETNVKTLCDSLEGKTPDGVNFFKINGHNHVAAFNENGFWYTAGMGGKSHYECGNGSGWTCNNSDYGYLELVIDNETGKITAKFFKTNGDAMF